MGQEDGEMIRETVIRVAPFAAALDLASGSVGGLADQGDTFMNITFLCKAESVFRWLMGDTWVTANLYCNFASPSHPILFLILLAF